jgi:hypothetical protein
MVKQGPGGGGSSGGGSIWLRGRAGAGAGVGGGDRQHGCMVAKCFSLILVEISQRSDGTHLVVPSVVVAMMVACERGVRGTG